MDYEKEALAYHRAEPAGKIKTSLTKPVNDQTDLAIAYSPGVAGPCREIHKNEEDSFVYTGRGNLVGVISNGTAVLGLGDIGPHAAKPVMEGKAMLFKKFADIDVFDIEIDAKDPHDFIKAVKALEPTFGGINLEDIKAPECFLIEEELRKTMAIPVFHDDQHGTAIIASAAFLNAIEITKRKISETKVVFSGGGAAAIACASLFLKIGVHPDNLIMCDTKGVLHTDRDPGNPYKAKFVRKTHLRTLEEALEGADAFVGVSAGGVLTGPMIQKMSPNPIIFALANPDPEILPDEARKFRPDAIIATGRSDYPNQVNNVLGFPFIFRGALDTRATTINDEMKMAAVHAIANLAKEDVPEEVLRAYHTTEGYFFGRDYLIPKPVDPRVLLRVAPAVAQAAIESGVARRQLDINVYRQQIERILGPTRRIVRQMRNEIATASKIKRRKPVVVLPHSHDSRVLKATAQIYYEGDVQIILLGSTANIVREAQALGLRDIDKKCAIIDPLTDERVDKFANQLFQLRARKGVSRTRAYEILRNPAYFASMLVLNGEADGLLTGLVEPYAQGVRPILEVIGTTPNQILAGIQMIVHDKKLYFIADCTINVDPTPEDLAEIAITTAAVAKHYTTDPIRLAFLSFSSFGSNRHPKARAIAQATEILESKKPDFLFDGELQADAALNIELQTREFPFCKLMGRANVLVFPDLTSANIAYKLLCHLADATSTGPILVGARKPAHVLERGASVEDTINMIYLTANQAFRT